MRYSRRCTSNGFRAAGPRCGGFSSVMISPIKKSLCAAERHRKDVARARRLWILPGLFHDGAEAGAAALVGAPGNRLPPCIEGGTTAPKAHAHSICIFDPGGEPVRRHG